MCVKYRSKVIRAIGERLNDDRKDVVAQTFLDRRVEAGFAPWVFDAELGEQEEQECGFPESPVAFDVVFLALAFRLVPFISDTLLNLPKSIT